MRSPAPQLILGALPAIVAGFFVLGISGGGLSLWLVQGGSALLMLAIAAVMSTSSRSPGRAGLVLMACMGIVLCALPLLGGGSGPRRWLTLGPASLYVAPVVLPTLLALAATAGRWGWRGALAPATGLWAAACVLACEPDLSQVLALTAGAAVIVARARAPWPRRVSMLLPFAAPIGLAAVQDDPLAPVSYVELVIEVSWAHSIVAGLGVSSTALVLVATVARCLARTDATAIAVASYYAVLFICSMLGWTPAPLIGFGAGPLLGFGVLAGTVALLARHHETNR